jgi:hypothetical protein
VRVLETQALWGEAFCRVWLPVSDTVARVRAERLRPLAEAGVWGGDAVAFVAAAARVVAALEGEVLLAPLEAPVIPLPHQMRALARATRSGWGRRSRPA